jgi:hypothetical protein
MRLFFAYRVTVLLKAGDNGSCENFSVLFLLAASSQQLAAMIRFFQPLTADVPCDSGRLNGTACREARGSRFQQRGFKGNQSDLPQEKCGLSQCLSSKALFRQRFECVVNSITIDKTARKPLRPAQDDEKSDRRLCGHADGWATLWSTGR